jgi:hypothetical protein
MLDPYELNLLNPDFKKDVVFSPGFAGNNDSERRKIDKWLPLARAARVRKIPRHPLAVYPAYFARRFESQKSSFTIHGSDAEGLTKSWKLGGPLLRIVIPGQKAGGFRGMLRDMGIDSASVYPDMQGLGRLLAEKWGPVKFRQPHEGVFVRLKPSKIRKGGVGVFAIRPIPKGTNVFKGEIEKLVWTDANDLPKLSALKKLYYDFGVLRGIRYATPVNFNSMGPGWYLNSSKKPNVRCDENLDFFALRDIKVGEELTADYDAYSDPVPSK